MAEREALGAEPALGVRPAQARLHRRGERGAVHAHEPVEPPQVERHHAAEAVPDRLHPADHAGAAAEGHDGHAVLGAGRQHRAHLLGRAGQDHRVGRAGAVAGSQADEVRIGAARGVAEAGGTVVADVFGPQGPHQRVARRTGQSRLPQPHVRFGDRRTVNGGVEADLVGQELRAGRRQLDVGAVLAPAPPAHR